MTLPTDPDREHINEIFRTLRKIDRDMKPSTTQHDRVPILISSCIIAGLDEGKRIAGTLKKLGYDGRFVGMMLNYGTGNDPARHHWQRNADGTYRILDKAAIGLPA